MGFGDLGWWPPSRGDLGLVAMAISPCGIVVFGLAGRDGPRPPPRRSTPPIAPRHPPSLRGQKVSATKAGQKTPDGVRINLYPTASLSQRGMADAQLPAELVAWLRDAGLSAKKIESATRIFDANEIEETSDLQAMFEDGSLDTVGFAKPTLSKIKKALGGGGGESPAGTPGPALEPSDLSPEPGAPA
eukprot:SAG22_NODE_7293_length_754_cov_1.480916_2_plen_187_part_01